MTSCPSAERLGRLGSDSLASDEFRALEAHLVACTECRDRLDGLARLDTPERPARALAAAKPPEIPGCVLGRKLGRGGSGVVYEAFQPTLERRVAVKILTAGAAADEAARRRWLREARAIARVRHPNIVHLHDAGEHEGRLFLVLDLVEGGSLRDRLAGRPIPPGDAARIVEATARAVEESHKAGIVHLDVKPSNILMDGPGQADWGDLTPMLSDFGIARPAGERTREAMISGALGVGGTPAFMAPEQVAGRPEEIGPAADVHALGATLYALLTGRPPFLGASPVETIDLLRTAEPPPPRALAPGVPRDLETICLKALEKAPARRYASAVALADDLARFREGRPILARPISAAGRLTRWARRRPTSAALGASLIATILAALLALTILWRRSEAALARAVEGESAAEAAVTDLLGLLRRSIDPLGGFVDERTEKATDAVLALTARLRSTPGLSAGQVLVVADLEVDLSKLLSRKGYLPSNLRPLEDAESLLAVATDPAGSGDDRSRLEIRRAEILLIRAGGLVCCGLTAEAAALVPRIDLLLEPHRAEPRVLDALATLRDLRGRLARMIPSFPAPDSPGDDLRLRLVDACLRYEADWPDWPSDDVWEVYRRLPADLALPPNLASRVHTLAALDLCRSAIAEARTSSTFDPQSLTRRLLVELDAMTARLRPAERDFDGIVEQLSQSTSSQCIYARRAGRIDEVHRHIAWMIAVGRELARRNPRAAAPHLMIGRAYEQGAKLAWGPPANLAAVERSLRAALDEASLAQTLEPDREEVRRAFGGIRDKYLRCIIREPESPGPAASR
ncbi:serine/threonine-protein kinase [Aquisphaera insulae]|uniref:serine/threonine-protein kinase n=1 Tax=Aquisphaera insulae TaxID=2712864 RepID=UPI0013EAAF53|nr:serine/threonine-protein kinase [Aquisphaera insulae]